MNSQSLAEQINEVLPQTQCTKCGYDGCRPYAEALAKGQADLNRCPPGGEEGITKLAHLLDLPTKPLDTSCGVLSPLKVARIDENHCIGCTLCIQACPVDAIVGANKRMHTVLADWCTGCDLCLPPCPVDCITMEVATENPIWDLSRAKLARHRYERHQRRTARAAEPDETSKPASLEDRRSAIAAALAKARSRRSEK